jgi:hypothetical protein
MQDNGSRRVVCMDNREVLDRLATIEDHFLHPMFRAREAIQQGRPVEEIIEAIEADQSWYSDIHNETDAKISTLVGELKGYK